MLDSFLRTTPLAWALTDAERADLIRAITLKTYPAGTALYRVGDQISHVMLVVEGKIRFELAFVEGQSNHLGVIGRGEHCGDMEILTRFPSVANATAIEDSTIARIPAEVFLTLFRSKPEVAQMQAMKFGILFYLGQQILAVAVSESVDKKLALLLLGLDAQLGSGPTQQRTIAMKLAQEELATMLGVTRQSISKPLTTWKRQGWISIRNKIITLHNVDALRALASFNLDVPRLGELTGPVRSA